MNGKSIVSAIMAMSLATGGVAFAQGYGDRNDRGRNEQVAITTGVILQLLLNN